LFLINQLADAANQQADGREKPASPNKNNKQTTTNKIKTNL